MAEDELIGWHHRLIRHEFEQTPEIEEDRAAWCATVHGVERESGMTEQLNNNYY